MSISNHETLQNKSRIIHRDIKNPLKISSRALHCLAYAVKWLSTGERKVVLCISANVKG